MGKGGACGGSGCGSSSSGSIGSNVSSGYRGIAHPSGLNDFYQGINGVYRPTDGNLYAPRQSHGTPDWNPIKLYEGSSKSLLGFNIGTTYKNQSIDNKVTGNYDPQKTRTTGASYFRIPSFMDYL